MVYLNMKKVYCLHTSSGANPSVYDINPLTKMEPLLCGCVLSIIVGVESQ